ncbi:MarR family winged helix-turn-helix transcriptional regulator [Rhodoplanes sp. Z2-YC6860]|uniref:MarR family winged helix-turn-helix transcriptional regulator n=1 Tax=Rhodoplanes sp. Z2-YC6860 TaxID=674703 RepID=UPI00078CC244|nr:MarR family transcriptional regulator [Rhodoplanes sp. Z2-YC6860]AMN44527.1 transcriptional regulator, MarR family [Rhodoplanes sp. Z2-YC6860]
MLRRSSAGTKQRTAAKSHAPAPVKLGWLGGTVGFYLRTAQEAAFQAYSRKANGADARPWRFAVLSLIGANSGLTQGELAAALRRNTSSLTPVLDDLCRQGYVTRERLESDRRTYALKLTPKGKAAEAKLLAAAMAHERDIDRIVGAHRAQFVRILKGLASALTQEGSLKLQASPRNRTGD